MTACGSSSRSSCRLPTLDVLERWGAEHLRGGRVVPREHLHVTLAFLGSRPATELDVIVERPARGRLGGAGSIALEPVAWRETRSVGMVALRDLTGEASARSPARLHARLAELGVYRPESRRMAGRTSRVLRFRERPRLDPPLPGDGNIRSVRCRCLPISTAPVRRSVRGARTRLADRRRMNRMNREEALDVALGQIERQFGKGSVMRMSDAAQVSIGAVSTGSLSLDMALGIGGLPRGRIVEIFGPESSGKTTLVYHVIAEAQRRGGICAFIDAEHSMDPTYARRIGVDIDQLLVSQPDTGEQALEIAELLIRSGAVDIVAVDSVAALTPKAEIEGEMGDSHVGLQARLMSQALRKLAGTLNRTDTICIFTNQLREKIGVMFGSPETTPGGRALKFYSSVRLDIRRIETLKEGTEAVGNRVRVKVVKNKVAPPFKQAEFDVIYGQGISWEGTVLDVGLERKIVTKSGSYFSFGDERLGQGRQNATAFLTENPDLVQSILARIQAEAGPEQIVSARLLPSAGGAPAGGGAGADEVAAEV